MSVWVVAGGLFELVRSFRPRSKFAPEVPLSVQLVFLAIALAAAVGLHVAVWYMRCWLNRRSTFLEMSQGAWTVLLLICYWLDFGFGAYLFFSID